MNSRHRMSVHLKYLFYEISCILYVKTSSAPSSEKTAMVSLQVPESNSTLVILHDYCKQDCTFSDYINYAVGRGQQLLSARPTAAYINKGRPVVGRRSADGRPHAGRR